MHHDNREAWLNGIAHGLAPHFEQLGAPLPTKIRIAIGFTSNGKRSRAIGECWDNRCSQDGHFEIFIRPDLAESEAMMPLQIAAILAHELVHAAVGIPAGHRGAFRRIAKGLGLVGKMTATLPGPVFEALIAPILREAGPLPHARLRTSAVAQRGASHRFPAEGTILTTAPRKQPSRQIKCLCPACGYTVRTSRLWLDRAGAPHCPGHGAMVTVKTQP